MRPQLLALIAIVLPQSTPSGGAIAKFVPPVPTPASFISDERKVLTPAGHAEVDAKIRAIQAAGRGDIAVAIIPSIGDYSPSQVGVEIYRTWKVGQVADIGSAKRDLGVLILIVPKELSPNNRGECWITTGMGAEGMITDAFASSVCRQRIIPFLQRRAFDAALVAGVDALDQRLRMDPALAASADSAIASRPNVTYSSPRALQLMREQRAAEARTKKLMIGGGIGGFLVLIAGLIGGRRWWRHRPRRCKRCGEPMTRLDEGADDAHLEQGQLLEERVKSVDYDVWRCVCGNVVVIPWRSWFTEYAKCRECQHLTAKSRRRVIRSATYSSDGLAEDLYTCQHCKATWTERVVLPQKQRASSGSGGSGGSRGGGSSFGGSGRTGGGGGGGSY